MWIYNYNCGLNSAKTFIQLLEDWKKVGVNTHWQQRKWAWRLRISSHSFTTGIQLSPLLHTLWNTTNTPCPVDLDQEASTYDLAPYDGLKTGFFPPSKNKKRCRFSLDYYLKLNALFSVILGWKKPKRSVMKWYIYI